MSMAAHKGAQRVPVSPPLNAALLSDLARVRAIFQLRTIEAVIRGSM
jgi:hypothetical protein